ncbi:MAG: hypothetical protein ACUVSK_02550 [Desulfotomaculales bacterium]
MTRAFTWMSLQTFTRQQVSWSPVTGSVASSQEQSPTARIWHWTKVPGEAHRRAWVTVCRVMVKGPQTTTPPTETVTLTCTRWSTLTGLKKGGLKSPKPIKKQTALLGTTVQAITASAGMGAAQKSAARTQLPRISSATHWS